MSKLLGLGFFSAILSLLCTTNALADAYATFPVSVIEEVNGSIPAGCSSVNNSTGGPPEVSLDLDADGIADICLGSGTTTCGGSPNLDCSGNSGNSSCSTQSAASDFMGNDLIAATNDGTAVGPNFGNTVSSVGTTGATPLVVGFQGTSTNANLTGYFNMQIDAVDANICSYSFDGVYVDDGSEGLNYGDVVAPPVPPAPPVATAVPAMSIWGIGLLTGLIGLMGMYHRRRK